MAFRKVILASAIAVALAGCGADDQAYDFLDKDSDQISIASITSYEPVTDYQNIKEIPLPGVWMYRPSTSSAPRDSDMYAFFAGGEVLVSLSLTEHGLVAKRIDPDIVKYDPNNPQSLEESRWEDSINATPVLKIPGDYTAYRCQEDSYGDCTNKEEKVPELQAEWYERTHFLPKFEDLEAYINDINDYFGKDAKATKVAMSEFDPNNGVINIELEREFKGGNGKGRFFYSLVRLDKFADPKYQAVYQAPADQNKFGFFTSSFKKADTNGSTQSEFTRGSYLNRFSPNRESIDFYLNDEFFEPGNELWLKATLESMDTMAQQMSAIGIPPVKVINRDKPAGIVSGDLRYNAINLFTEPSDTGLLGYGPSAANPLTGEIISAYTNMYPGTVLKTVPRQWDQFVDLYNANQLADLQKNAEPVEATGITANSVKVKPLAINESEGTSDGYFAPETERVLELKTREMTIIDPTAQIRSSEAYASLFGDAKEAVDEILDQDKVEEFWSRNNMFSAKNVWVSSTEKNSLPGIDFENQGFLNTSKQLKDWDALNYHQRKVVNNVFGVHNYKTTLVHEVGHNLGLRHNFEGSADKSNFYSEVQAQSLGLRGVPAASSIMDYAPSELDIEPLFGQYDIAALRLAYAREIEDKNGSFHSLKPFDAKYANKYLQANLPENTERSVYSPITQLEFSLSEANSTELADYEAALDEYKAALDAYNQALADYDAAIANGTAESDLVKPVEPIAPVAPTEIALRSYEFCTDGNVGSTWSCDRHDEGTTRIESANYHYQNLRDFHEMFNFRGDDYSFTERGTIGRYFFFRNRMMDIASHGMQSWGWINMAAEFNGWPDADEFGKSMCIVQPSTGKPRWETACDYYNAAQKAGDLMVSILATPEKTCQVKVTEDKGQTLSIQNMTLSELYGKVRWDLDASHKLPLNCFDKTLKDQLKINFDEDVPNNREGFEVIAELEGGQFMNHQTAGSTVNHEMSDWSNYDEIDAFGVWFYRLIAAEMIASRDMVRGGDTAILDIPTVRNKVDELVRHWVVGTEYSDYKFVDQNGQYVASQAPYSPDYTTQKISRLGYPENIIMSWFTHINRTQETNLVEATLKALAYDAESAHPEKKFLSRNFIDSISVLDTTGDAPRVGHLDLELDGRKYSAGREHKIAQELISKALNSEVFRTEAYLKSEPSLDGVTEFVEQYDVQWKEALKSAPQFSAYMSTPDQTAVLRQPGAYALMSAVEPHMVQYNIVARDKNSTADDVAAARTTLFSALDNVVGELITAQKIVVSNTAGCAYQFTDGVCVIDSQGKYTSTFYTIINYTTRWIPSFWAEAKEVAKQFDTNFLQKHEGKEYLGKDFDMLKSFTIGTDFELRKYQEAKMIEKLPHYYR
ncbi:zinc-dependent metalloprotease [Vibrio vulnificus]|uniref:zinc-dependent metalloprotease n=1 Tax=Vibrio vulnificus TaxID=672 RepID=UPI003EDA52BC